MKVVLYAAGCALLSLIAFETSFGNRTRPDDDQEKQAQSLLGQARELTDIRSSGSHPFRLIASVQLFDGKASAAQGMYTLMWESPAVWRDEIKFADYSEIRVAAVDKLLVSRTPRVLPLEIFRLFALLDFPQVLHPAPNARFGKVKERTRNGAHERTVEMGRWIVSLDDSSPLPVRVEDKSFHFGFKFEDYLSFVGHKFPRTLTEFVASNKTLAQVRLEELAEATFDSSAFLPPQGASVLRWCPQPEPARLMDRGDVRPMPAQLRELAQHVVAVYGIIGTDGRWHDLAVVKSAGQQLDSYWMTQKLQERYSPANCGGVPVEQESVQELHYETLP